MDYLVSRCKSEHYMLCVETFSLQLPIFNFIYFLQSITAKNFFICDKTEKRPVHVYGQVFSRES